MKKITCEDCGHENRMSIDHYCSKCSNELM